MRLTTVAPAYCAACFQHDATIRHVDFEGAYDGPVLTLEDGRKQPIDDLVLCEKCLVAAFELIDPDKMRERLDRAVEYGRMQTETVQDLEKQVNRLRELLSEQIKVPQDHLPKLPRKPQSEAQRKATAENIKKAQEARKRNAARRRREKEIERAKERVA